VSIISHSSQNLVLSNDLVPAPEPKRRFKVYVVPKFSIASALTQLSFEPYLQYLKAQYLGAKMAEINF
jgi:hypothetical protein